MYLPQRFALGTIILCFAILPQQARAQNITEKEISDYYDAHKEQFNIRETQYHLIMIVVTPVKDPEIHNLKNDDATTELEAKQKLQMLMESLNHGTDFTQLAFNYSEDSSAARGGDIGYIPASGLNGVDPVIRATVISLKPGQVSDPITARGSYVIIKLSDRVEPGQRDLADPLVQQSIRNTLRQAAHDSVSAGPSPSENAGKTSQPKSGESHIEAGLRLFDNNQLKESIEQFRMATNDDPKNPRAWFFLGRSYLGSMSAKQENGHLIYGPPPPGMAEAYQKAVELDPTGQYGKAAAKALNSLRVEGIPIDGGEASSISSSSGNTENLPRASEDSTQNVQSSQKNSGGNGAAPLTPQENEAKKHYVAAQEALKNGDLKTASRELKAASTLSSKNALIWYDLAVVESKQQNTSEATTHLRKAISLGLPAHEKGSAEKLLAELQNGSESPTTAQKASPGAEHQANSDDILDWITTNATLGLNLTMSQNSPSGDSLTKFSVSIARLDDPCTVQIVEAIMTTYNSAGDYDKTQTTITLHLRDMIPDALVTEYSGGEHTLTLRAAGGKATIDTAQTGERHMNSIGINRNFPLEKKQVEKYEIHTVSLDYANRFKHAFDDLASACGGVAPKVSY